MKGELIRAGLAAALLAGVQLARAQEPAQVFVQLGHRSAVTAMAFSPDGHRLATASLDGAVKLWDVNSGRVAATMTGHAGSVLGIAWSPDGATIATAGRDRTLRTWNPRAAAPLAVHRGHENIVLAVAFVDASRFASAGYDGSIRLWRVGETAPTAELGRHGEPVRAIAVSRDGRLLASAGEDRAVRIWDVAGRAAAGELAGLPTGALSVGFSLSGDLAIGTADGAVRTWSGRLGDAPRVVGSHGGAVNALAYSPDGRLLASASGDGSVRLWDAASGRVMATLPAGNEQNALAFSRGGSLLAAGGLDHAVRLWSVPDAEPRDVLRSPTAEMRAMEFSADGAVLATGGADATVRIWDAMRAQVVRALPAGAPIEAIRVSRDGARVAAATQDGAARLWERASGRELARIAAHKGPAFALALSPDGAMLATGGRDGLVRVWDGAGRLLGELKGHAGAVRDLAFSPDGQRLASASSDDTVRVWEAASRRALAVFKGHTNRVNAVRFADDGARVVSAGEDSVLRVWDAASAAPLAVLAGHKAPVKALALRGNTIVSVGADEAVAVWDLAEPRLLGRASVGAGQLYAAAISSNGIVAAAGDGGPAILLDAATLNERVRLFGFNDGEWLSIVPAGHFHASPNAARHLNVRIGDRIHGLDQFVEAFLRPDLVREALADRHAERERANREELERIARERREQEDADARRREAEERARIAAAELARMEAERRKLVEKAAAPSAPAPRLAQVKPAPEVALVALPGEVAAPEVNVRLRIIERGGGVGDVRLYLNGSAIVQDRVADRAAGAGERDYLVRLAEGRNVIRAVAFNADNTMQSAEAVHELLARPAGRRRPQLHALVIGVQEFVNPRLRLSYSVADANLFAATLEARAGDLFQGVHVRRLVQPVQTTRAAIIAAIQEVRARVEPDDLFVFYVASHGTVDEGEYFLLTSNVGSTATERLRSEALGERDLRDLLANVPATKKLIVLDTCNAGRLGDVLQTAVLTRGMEEDRAAKVLARAVGSTVLSAATSVQEAIEGYKGHGLFTYVVAEALAGKADYDRDGYVKTTELALYVDNEVPELAEKVFRYKQFPIVSPTGMGFPVTRAGPTAEGR